MLCLCAITLGFDLSKEVTITVCKHFKSYASGAQVCFSEKLVFCVAY